MQELQALIQGRIPPQTIHIGRLIVLAERHPTPTSTEYKLLELAINIVLASYLEKAQKNL